MGPGSKNSRRDTGFPADLGHTWKSSLNSHCGNFDVLEIHTPLKYYLACLLGSIPGLPDGVFGYDKSALEVEILGFSNTCLAQ